jgi:hypothetical protein
MVNPRPLVLSLVLATAASRGVPAQRLEAPLASWSASLRVTRSASSAMSRQLPSRDYRVEGAVVGALLLGAVGYWIGHEACTHQPQPTSPNGRNCSSDGFIVGLVGVGVGGGLGYFVGRSIGK